jgi:hypothetical protein
LVWFCWMWLVAVVRRCLVGSEHYEGFCSVEQKPSEWSHPTRQRPTTATELNRNLHSANIPQDSAPQPLPTTSNKTRPIYTKCSNRAFDLLKMGIMMSETCWDRS